MQGLEAFEKLWEDLADGEGSPCGHCIQQKLLRDLWAFGPVITKFSDDIAGTQESFMGKWAHVPLKQLERIALVHHLRERVLSHIARDVERLEA